MAKFDLEKAAAVLGEGGGGIMDSLQMGFGIPNCVMGLATGALAAILPSSILGGMSDVISDAKAAADQAVADAIKAIFLDSGIIEFDTVTGKLKFISSASRNGLDKDESTFLAGLKGLVGAFAFGSAVWANIQSIGDQIDQMKDCFDSWLGQQKFAGGNSSDLKAGIDFDPNDLPTTAQEVLNNYADKKAAVAGAMAFIEQANAALSVIGKTLSDREQGLAPEPVLDLDAIDNSVLFNEEIKEEIKSFLRASGFLLLEGSEGRCSLGENFPTREACERSGGIWEVVYPDENNKIFDLVYGPPKSKKGQFILSVDGLYYDYLLNSRGISVSAEHPLAIPDEGLEWLFEYDPNLGGKGTAISKSILDRFIDTIFDPNQIGDSNTLIPYYDKDHFLQTIIQQKNKHIYDLSGELTDLIDEEGTHSAIVVNKRQSLYSNIALYQSKINRRKKQIEVAVVAPRVFADETLYAPGEIPINDFGYLQELNLPVSLGKQQKISFVAGEVSGVVLPHVPKFVVPKEVNEANTFDYLLVPKIGRGGIVTLDSSTTEVSDGTQILSLNDHITSEDLLFVYNFLESNVLSNPGSPTYQVLNCATDNLYGNAQLVGESSESTIVSGLGIPYLRGIGGGGYDSTTSSFSSVGSYVKLPDIKEINDLTYADTGFSFDFWTHVPEIGSASTVAGWDFTGTPQFHKIILGCENTGGDYEVTNPERMPYSDRSDVTKGFVMGFTTDRSIVSGLNSSTDIADNHPDNGINFYIAPTQSVNTCDVVFINNTTDIVNCAADPGFYKCAVDIQKTVNGASLADTSSNFVHINVSVDVPKNEVRIACDGELLTTSSIPQTFGNGAFTPPSLPTFVKENSFNYNSSNMGRVSPLQHGPKLTSYFTPWILGSGYTDGMRYDGGFMGTNQGTRSGLEGHLGSFKIYGKALTIEEAKKNFDAQSIFFKNIQT